MQLQDSSQALGSHVKEAFCCTAQLKALADFGFLKTLPGLSVILIYV